LKPIVLFTTPRSGSTFIIDSLYHLGKRHFAYKNCLFEYFFVDVLYRSKFEKVDGIVIQTDFERMYKDWCQDKRQERLQRLSYIVNDPYYAWKIFPSDLEPEIEQFINEKYDVVYLERRNLVNQFLSLLGLLNYNTSHYKQGETKKIKQLIYKKGWLLYFIDTIEKYLEFKNNHPSKYPTLYYEDILAQSNQEEFINQYLNLGISNYTNRVNHTIPTPYIDNPENLVVNKESWLEGKKILLDFIDQKIIV